MAFELFNWLNLLFGVLGFLDLEFWPIFQAYYASGLTL